MPNGLTIKKIKKKKKLQEEHGILMPRKAGKRQRLMRVSPTKNSGIPRKET